LVVGKARKKGKRDGKKNIENLSQVAYLPEHANSNSTEHKRTKGQRNSMQRTVGDLL